LGSYIFSLNSFCFLSPLSPALGVVGSAKGPGLRDPLFPPPPPWKCLDPLFFLFLSFFPRLINLRCYVTLLAVLRTLLLACWRPSRPLPIRLFCYFLPAPGWSLLFRSSKPRWKQFLRCLVSPFPLPRKRNTKSPHPFFPFNGVRSLTPPLNGFFSSSPGSPSLRPDSNVSLSFWSFPLHRVSFLLPGDETFVASDGCRFPCWGGKLYSVFALLLCLFFV